MGFRTDVLGVLTINPTKKKIKSSVPYFGTENYNVFISNTGYWLHLMNPTSQTFHDKKNANLSAKSVSLHMVIDARPHKKKEKPNVTETS